MRTLLVIPPSADPIRRVSCRGRRASCRRCRDKVVSLPSVASEMRLTMAGSNGCCTNSSPSLWMPIIAENASRRWFFPSPFRSPTSSARGGLRYRACCSSDKPYSGLRKRMPPRAHADRRQVYPGATETGCWLPPVHISSSSNLIPKRVAILPPSSHNRRGIFIRGLSVSSVVMIRGSSSNQPVALTS